MKSTLRYLVAGLTLALGGAVATASPVTATFTYNFGSGNVFEGSLAGNLHDQGTATIADDYIDGITSLAAQFNGVDLRGPLFFGAYDSTGRREDLPVRLYLNLDQAGASGFIVDNCGSAVACSLAALTDYNYFFLRKGNNEQAQFYDHLTGRSDVTFSGFTYTAPEFTVDIAAVVPEPGTLALVLLGLTAAARGRVLRRRAPAL